MGYKILRYIKKEEIDSIEYRIEKRLFHVKIKYIDTLDHEFIRNYGHIVSDLEEDTINNLESKVTCAYSVLQLATILKKGLSFYLISSSEEHEMYNLIREYISYWAEKARTTYGLPNIPHDKLMALSELATIIYKLRDRRKDYKYNDEVVIRAKFGTFDSQLPHLNEMIKIKNNQSEYNNVLNIKEKPKEEYIPHLNDIELLDNIFKDRKNWELGLKR